MKGGLGKRCGKNYIEKDSPQNASSVARRLIEGIDSLQYLPYRFKVYRMNRNPERVVRSTPIRPYILYYRVIESEKVVIILTVRHGAQRQPRTFE